MPSPLASYSDAEIAAAKAAAALKIKARKEAAEHPISWGVHLDKYHDNPLAFIDECFKWKPGEGPAPYQRNVIDLIPSKFRVCLRGPRTAGKSFTAALLIIWFAITREAAQEDWKCILIAGVARQLNNYLWPEVKKWLRRLDWEKIGRPSFNRRDELLMTGLHLAYGQVMMATSDDPKNLEGGHADEVLMIMDESKNIPVGVFDATEPILAGAGMHYIGMFSTPGEPAGRFWEISTKATQGYEDWYPVHVTIQQVLAAGRVKESYIEQRKRQWGEDSALYQNQILGEFKQGENDGIIPLAWIEAAQERWDTWYSNEWAGLPEVTCLACDIAEQGEDQTVITTRHGNVVTNCIALDKKDQMQVAGRLISRVKEAGNNPMVIIDIGGGYGSGTLARLKEQDYRVKPFMANWATDARDQNKQLEFRDTKAAAWWHMRELLDPANGHDIALPHDFEGRIIGDLSAPHYEFTSTGKIFVEKKVDIRARIGRSTDFGDSIIMAFWDYDGKENAFMLPSMEGFDVSGFTLLKDSVYDHGTLEGAVGFEAMNFKL